VGFEQGFERGRINIAHKALEQGLVLENVSALTGLSVNPLKSIDFG
jgi:hypothetical protein